MDRVRVDVKCDECGQEPQQNDQGQLVCECAGKSWSRKIPIGGSAEDRATLERYGWQLVELPHATYWVGPVANAILYLYADDTWQTDPATTRFVHLSEYLKWYADGLR